MITVVIPTYNAKATIKAAIDSVIKQVYTDWELIVVDDCSKDATRTMVQQYVNNNDKIRLIANKQNCGVGVTRKVGLEAANGEFITFLDSDDTLNPDFLYTCNMLQQQHDSDIVYTSMNIVLPNKEESKIPTPDYILEGSATIQLQMTDNMLFFTGNVYRTDLLKTIPWSEKRIGEDTPTLFYACYYAKKVRTTSYSGYNHIFRYGSLLAQKDFFYRFCHSTMISFELIEFLLAHNEEEILKYKLTKLVIGHNQLISVMKQTDFATSKDITWKNYEDSLDVWTTINEWYKKNKSLLERYNLYVKEYYKEKRA